MNSINQQENSSKDEEFTRYNEKSELEQKDSNEELINETTSSSDRNNEKQFSSVLPPNDVSNEYENTGLEMEEMSNFSVNATGRSMILKVATSWAKFSRVNDYQIRFILDLIILHNV